MNEDKGDGSEVRGCLVPSSWLSDQITKCIHSVQTLRLDETFLDHHTFHEKACTVDKSIESKGMDAHFDGIECEAHDPASETRVITSGKLDPSAILEKRQNVIDEVDTGGGGLRRMSFGEFVWVHVEERPS